MIVTKMALPRRTFLRGWARRWRCRCSTRWSRRLTARAQTTASPVRRLGFVYIPMGMNAARVDAAGAGPHHRAVAVAGSR